jgi:transcriptional regulator with XRE-family HTH domain
MTTFAEVLQRHLKEQGISQYRLAKLTGLDESLPSYWVQGKKVPIRKNVAKVADALGLEGNERAELFAVAGYWPDHWPVERITVYGWRPEVAGERY